MLCPVEAKHRCIVEISSSVLSRPITMAFTTRGYQVIRYDQEEFKSDPCPAMLAAEIYNQMEMENLVVLIIRATLHGEWTRQTLSDWACLLKHLITRTNCVVIWDFPRLHPWTKTVEYDQLRKVLMHEVYVDWCYFGACDPEGLPVRGERKMLSNVSEIKKLQGMCKMNHEHRTFRTPQMCEKYGWPEAFVEAVDHMIEDVDVEGLRPVEEEVIADEGVEEQGGLDWHELHGHVPYRSDCRVCVSQPRAATVRTADLSIRRLFMTFRKYRRITATLEARAAKERLPMLFQFLWQL